MVRLAAPNGGGQLRFRRLHPIPNPSRIRSAMPDQPVSQKIEDLRARLRLDPKSRLFYPLAEELRKVGRLDEAEKVLRDGVQHHPTYLSGWVSLSRVLVERNQHREATEVLMKALALDPG